MTTTNQEIGQQNLTKALILIGRFKWLRLQEIGLFLWPYSPEKNQYQYSKHLVNLMVEKDLAFTQKMPSHAGTAVVLKEKGAKIVRENGFDVRRAKLSNDENGKPFWPVPRNWKHDLMAHGFAALSQTGLDPFFLFLMRHKPKFWTESELRKSQIKSNRMIFEHLDPIRIPDLMIESDDGILGIEFERSRKFGQKNRENMILNLIQTNKKEGVARHNFSGIEPAKICFAFNPDEREGNKSINHKLNIETSALAAMEKQGIQQLELAFILLKIKNYGVIDFNYEIQHNSIHQKASNG